MKKTTAILLAIALIPLLSTAEDLEKRTYFAKPINPHPPTINGVLEDSVWEIPEWAGDFIQWEPYEGKEPSQKTAFKILYDDNNLYVAVRAFDSHPAQIERRMARRDNLEGDWVEVSIDSFFDKRTAFCFAVNSAGVKRDQVLSNDGENHDLNWDPIWYVSTTIDDQGWIAEMRIPLSQLRFAKSDDPIWGLQVTRNLFRQDERSVWQFIPKDSPGWVHDFGELKGLEGIKPARQVEIMPYSVGSLQTSRQQAGNPFSNGTMKNIMGGLDGKIGLTNDLTLNFTINPDFGQVEADPSVVNLTAFETYYEEKRPFFIEGRNILSSPLMIGDGDLSSDNLFYSRRIGRLPQRGFDEEEGEYVDMPENTSILSAFKLTGKTGSGISIGILDSITGTEFADIGMPGQLRREPIEPLTNYFGLRLQKDYNQGNTILGTMMTATNRSINNPELDFLHKAAYTGGIDFSHSWKDRTYNLVARVFFSHVRGSQDAILRTQESPLRYYQRPDADHITLDPSRTSLTGHGGTVFASKFGNGHFDYMAGVTWRSPGFELNDMGYQRSADMIMQWTWAGYRLWEPFSVFRRMSVWVNQWQGWDFSGANTFDGGNIGMGAQLKNHWQINSGINRNGESLSVSALRGGPSLRWPGGWNYWLSIDTDKRKNVQFNLMTGQFWGDSENMRTSSYQLGGMYQPSNALSVSINPTYSLNQRNLQYVDTIEVENQDRYIFARIDQRTLGIILRMNYSISPDLSIQYYGQPFISAGQYSQFKHITAPRAGEYTQRYHQFTGDEITYQQEEGQYQVDENLDGITDYPISNPNFNFLQFRSNLIVRWEYTPGSAVFLVWSQGRTGDLSSGDFSFRNDINHLFDVHPTNVFLVKFSYCFQL